MVTLNLRFDRGQTSLRPHRGDPIAKGGNHRRKEDPPELAEPEPAGGRRTGKKGQEATNPLVQQAVGAQPQVQQGSTPKAHSKAAEEARRRQSTGKYSDKPGKVIVLSFPIVPTEYLPSE